MNREYATTTAESADIVVGTGKRRIHLRQVFFFLAGLTILFLLLRLLRLVLGERLIPERLIPERLMADERGPAAPQSPQPAPPAGERPAPPARLQTPAAAQRPKQQARIPRRAAGKKAAGKRAAGRAGERAGRARKRRSRRRLADRLLLAAEVTAVVLFVGAAVAAWQTLGELNDTYRTLQRVDARMLPTVMPAADPGRLTDTLAQSGGQDEGMFASLSLLPAPALPTPIPTSTPQPTQPAPTAPAPIAAAPAASGGDLGWGTSVVMSARGQALEQARRIHIPAIEVDSFVYQDYGPDWLKLGVVQFGERISPGQPGNLVLAAHNDIYGEIFRDLDQLQPGEEVTIFSESRRYTYRVRETVVVEPTDTWVTLPTSRSTLTLISCYPYLVGTQRIVVFADLSQ
ncbi:MAG TPA: sortase [Candidatus Sulfomarinibacteraceae bacterium]|nr:sortase [Candidatus Sulfomarinibacteraceae bacterium]